MSISADQNQVKQNRAYPDAQVAIGLEWIGQLFSNRARGAQRIIDKGELNRFIELMNKIPLYTGRNKQYDGPFSTNMEVLRLLATKNLASNETMQVTSYGPTGASLSLKGTPLHLAQIIAGNTLAMAKNMGFTLDY